MSKYDTSLSSTAAPHSSGWVVQTWAAFAISLSATLIGTLYLPVDNWVKAYMGMGTMFSVASTFSLSKTVRDLHEAKRLISRVDEAKLERMLAEHDPYQK